MFYLNDGGKSKSKRPKQTNDCVVRALSIALNINYDTMYEQLAESGRKCSRGTPHKAFYPLLDERALYIETFQAVKGEPRMNIEGFLKYAPQGTWVLRVSKHVFTIIDGTIHDEYLPRLSKCVYKAWRIK